MLIINADDFGRDENANRAVMACFEKGLCSSATIMANMPGFEEACALTHARRLRDHVGLHLVLRGGMPLTDAIRRCSVFCDRDGRLCLARRGAYPTWGFDRSEREALAEEIRAQVRRCRANGLPLTHLDSHYHLHADWGVLGVVLAVVKEERIPYVRIARNCGRIARIRRAYKWMVNTRLRREGLARTRYLGSVRDYLYSRDRLARVKRDERTRLPLELMIHPRVSGTGDVAEHGVVSLRELIADVDGHREAVSFCGARYA